MGLSLVMTTSSLCRATATAVVLLVVAVPARGGDSGASWNDGDLGARVDIVACWSRSTEYSRTIEGAHLPKDPGPLAVRRWIREAVENTWGRYANMEFYQEAHGGAWDFCTSEDEERSLVLGFSSTNRAEVGRNEAGPTHIWFDAKLTSRTDVELAAINLFGQAFELLPSDTPFNHVPTPQELADAQTVYGSKYPGALIGYSGHCVSNENGLVGTTRDLNYYRCFAGCPDRRWMSYAITPGAPPGLATWFDSNLTCVQPLDVPGSNVKSLSCSASEPAVFRFDQFKWKIAGELCVVADDSRVQSQLHLADCSVGSNARWDFNFLSPERVRLSGTDLCAGLETASILPGVALKLIPCADFDSSPVTSLDFTNPKTIGIGATSGYCAKAAQGLAVGSLVTIDNCTNGDLDQTFHITGVLSNNGYCLGVDLLPPYLVERQPKSISCVEDTGNSSALLPSTLEWDYYW